MPCKSKALSFIEFVTVIIIVSSIVVASVVSFTIVSSRTLESNARMIVGDLSWAREMAASRHIDHCVRFYADNYEIYERVCGVSDPLGKKGLDVSMSSPSVPFDLVFYSISSPPYIPPGTAFSAASNSGVLTINLAERDYSKNVNVFEETGYIEIE